MGEVRRVVDALSGLSHLELLEIGDEAGPSSTLPREVAQGHRDHSCVVRAANEHELFEAEIRELLTSIVQLQLLHCGPVALAHSFRGHPVATHDVGLHQQLGEAHVGLAGVQSTSSCGGAGTRPPVVPPPFSQRRGEPSGPGRGGGTGHLLGMEPQPYWTMSIIQKSRAAAPPRAGWRSGPPRCGIASRRGGPGSLGLGDVVGVVLGCV